MEGLSRVVKASANNKNGTMQIQIRKWEERIFLVRGIEKLSAPAKLGKTRLPNSCPFFSSLFSGEDLGSFLYIFDCFPGRKVARKISTYPRADIWSRVDIRQYVDSSRCTSLSTFFHSNFRYEMKFVIPITELIHLLDNIFLKEPHSCTFLECCLGELNYYLKEKKIRAAGNGKSIYTSYDHRPFFSTMQCKINWIQFHFLVSIIKTNKSGNCYNSRYLLKDWNILNAVLIGQIALSSFHLRFCFASFASIL